MTPKESAILDDILVRWHLWGASYRKAVSRGYNGVAAGMESYRASRQRDDENGALDAAIDNRIMAQVDFEVGEMPALEQMAVRCDARSLHLGIAVMVNPRLPSNPEDRAVLLRQARDTLHERLVASGVM